MELQSDIAHLQRENESLRREIAKLEDLRSLTYRDGLTGLWNRRYFAERLGSELSRSRRAGSRPFAFGLSMGTASFPEQGTSFDALVRIAEEARFEDKRRQSPVPTLQPTPTSSSTG